jgi:Monogalactosyldiacylglycerol (MGDG) synthase
MPINDWLGLTHLPAGEHSAEPVRLMFVYTNTGQGHRTTADALAEMVMRSSAEAADPVFRMTHVDIYRLSKVFLFRRAGQHYQMLCRHMRWLYDLLFRATDSPVAKSLVTKTIVSLYGRRIKKVLADHDPELIVVLHPLFMSDVLCELRNRTASQWKILSFVTDLGFAHSGWTSPSLDSAFFVNPRQIDKLRAQRCLPPASRIVVARAPVRDAFTEHNRLVDGKLMENLSLDPPYILYLPGLLPRRVLQRQVEHLAQDYKGIPIVVVGSVPAKTILYLTGLDCHVSHLPSLSGVEMAAAMRNAEVIVGKAGPAAMAEAASVHVRFIPTAEVGRQEMGNSLIGRSMYGADSAPLWSLTYGRNSGWNTRVQTRLADHAPLGGAEVYGLLIKSVAEARES